MELYVKLKQWTCTCNALPTFYSFFADEMDARSPLNSNKKVENTRKLLRQHLDVLNDFDTNAHAHSFALSAVVNNFLECGVFKVKQKFVRRIIRLKMGKGSGFLRCVFVLIFISVRVEHSQCFRH